MTNATPKNRRSAAPASDRERLERGRSRLQELLANPGPGIRIIPHASQLHGAPQQSPTSRQRHPGAAVVPTDASAVNAAARPGGPPATAEPKPGRPQQKSPASRPSAQAVSARPAAARAQGEVRRVQPTGNIRLKQEAAPPTPEPPPLPPPPAVRATAKAGENLAPAPTAGAAPASTRPTLATSGELEDAILASKQAFVSLGLFSFVINILMLAGPLFMLQVYDRVISSGSLPTLVALTVMTVGVYAIIGLLEIVRSRVIVRVGHQIDGRLGVRIFDAAIRLSAAGSGKTGSTLRDLDQLRQFVGSPGPLAFFDAPWTPVYLLVIFMAHWMLGLAATLGAAVLFGLAWLSETHARAPLHEAGKTATRSLDIAETGQRNAETIAAMGMGPDYRALWSKANRTALDWQLVAADRLGTMTALSRTLRLLMQSLMLAIGAWLAISGEITAGAIVASTIIFGRALAPVEQAIGHWRPFLKAVESFGRLKELLHKMPPERLRTALPAPTGKLEVKALRVASPATRQLILSGISFHVSPGEMLAVIGPSASGKSTLVRTLTGLWQPLSGTISLDGARLDQWHPEDLGRHVGYLPQSVELFSGSVRQNIARFAPNASDSEILEAATAAHAHELILALPEGYDTELGSFGTYLSGGQRQRIALARALFRNPALVILDEPNANLDRTGDVALSSAINDMRARGQAVILVSHRVQAIGKADSLLLMEKGQQRAFGPREAVMRMIRGETDPHAARQPAQPEAQSHIQPQAQADTQAQTPANEPPAASTARTPSSRAPAKTPPGYT
ncbi:MAG: type I secretion system permease/ATPase [Alphaproteobacteria bacterium]|nr:type I secretion system permease/ATPase [Alphaproteobacteria bacterium]